MHENTTCSQSLIATFVAALVLWAAPARSGDAAPSKPPAAPELRSRAAELYDEGRFPEARQLLDQLDATGAADGPSLYRLGYCQRNAGDTAEADRTQARARERLEAEIGATHGIEVPFYLVNTYQNLGLGEDMSRVAAATVQRFERGELGTPTNAGDMFRVGKLYADQGNEAQACVWYARSIDVPAEQGRPMPSYERWAARYLAEAKFRTKDFPAAARSYAVLLAAGDAGLADLQRLAIARLRIGAFGEAAAAWKQAQLLNPADDDAPRYAEHVAQLAAEVGTLPGTAPSGKAWGELSREELETLMREQADIVKTAVAEGSVEGQQPLPPDKRAALTARIAEARGPFAGAAVEYVARDLPIRETAFFGGYAPLLFRKGAWHLPRAEGAGGEHRKHAAGAVDEPTFGGTKHAP